jgi:hypothetical protein
MNISNLIAITEIYRLAKSQLEYLKAREFQSGSVVYVNADQYKGYGIVKLEDGVRPDELAVSLGNGNTWWYPVLACAVIKDRNVWPLEIKRMVRRQKLAATRAKKP